MPNLRITNQRISSGIKNTTVSSGIKNSVITSRLSNPTANVRVMSGGSVTAAVTTTTSFGGAGYPLGILLAITYTQSQAVSNTTSALVSDFKPSIRITNG